MPCNQLTVYTAHAAQLVRHAAHISHAIRDTTHTNAAHNTGGCPLHHTIHPRHCLHTLYPLHHARYVYPPLCPYHSPRLYPGYNY